MRAYCPGYNVEFTTRVKQRESLPLLWVTQSDTHPPFTSALVIDRDAPNSSQTGVTVVSKLAVRTNGNGRVNG